MNEFELMCRAALDAPAIVAGEVMYMPAGLNTITPSQGGQSVTVSVLVDKASAAALDQQRAALTAKGKRPYFDFNHDDQEASFWPELFFWKDGPKPGVYARGEWTDLGEAAIAGKRYRQFSPVFFVDNVRANPARIVARDGAKPNMGGLVNDPAFHTILPFWAKDAGAQSSDNNKTTQEVHMDEKQLAALQAKNTELQNEINALKAKAERSAVEDAQLNAKESEARAIKAELDNAALIAKTTEQAGIITARNEADAKAAVKSAVERGAIAAKDTETQTQWEKDIIADPTRAALLAKVPGSPALTAGRFTGMPAVGVTSEDPRAVFAELEGLIAKNSTSNVREEKLKLSHQMAALYAKEFKSKDSRAAHMPLSAANSPGTLAGTLVSQRTLELLKFAFPTLSRVTTDFSDAPAQYNQTVMSRIIGIPAVQTYDATAGWTDSSAAATDVPVTINAHKGVPLTFDANTLGSTARRLFDEFAPAQAYALAKDMVDALYAVILAANFTATAETVALVDFARQNLINVGVTLDLAGNPLIGRSVLLSSKYFGKLKSDQAIVTLAAFQEKAIIENGVLPEIEGFDVINAPNLLDNGQSLAGFGFTKSALVIATRLPNDYTTVLPGASYGNVMTITDPDIGISVQQVQYVNHQLGSATQRLALMYGVAKGQNAAGVRITSA